jgi:TP901 family phage tail tape measure protein
MSETAISRLYVMLGLKSTIGADGQKAISEANKTAVATGAALTAVGVAAKMAADDINRSYRSFESAMTEVKALGGVTQAEFESMRQSALDLSTEFPIAATAVADSMYLMISVGYDYRDMMSTIPDAAKLATAGSMEMAEATNSLLNVMDIYGDRAGDAAEISKIFANAVGVGKYEMDDFMTELMKNIGAANQLNIAFSDLAAYNVALQGSFASAEEAGTSFNAMLMKITTPATVAQLEEMGVAVENADGSFRDLTDIMADLGVALGGVTSDTERAAIVQELFGTYGQRAALSLIRQADALPELKKEMRDLNLIEDQTNVKLDGMAQRLEIADNQMEKAKITMGQAMAPATLVAADAMGAFATVLMMVPEPLQAIAGTGLTAAQSLIVIGPALAGIIPAINAYRASTFAATVATQGFTAALMLNPAALAAVAIGAVALSLGTYYLAARDAERASKDLNATGRSQLEIARDEVAAKRKDIEVTKEQIAYYEELIESNRRRARAAGIANDIEAESYLSGQLSNAKKELEKLNAEFETLSGNLERLEDAEIDIELSKSQHSVDTLESSLSELLRLMDELEGKERTKAELEDTEAIQEIRVRTSQKDLDEAEEALKKWRAGGDNAYAMEFGAEAGREREQELIDAVTTARVNLNRATREYNDTQEELNGLEEEFAEKESRVNELAAEMNATLPDLKLTLDDLAEGQDHVNQKVREAIAMTPAGIEALRIIDEFLASSSGAADTAPEAGTAVPVAVPGNEFYGKGYTPGYPEGFEVKEGGGLVRQPTGDRTPAPPVATVAARYAVEPLPAIQVEQPDPVIIEARYQDDSPPALDIEDPDPIIIDARYREDPFPAIEVEQPDPIVIDAQFSSIAPISPETYASYYPAAPLMPTITVEPISSEVLVSEQELNEIRALRNELDSDATLTNEDLQKIYAKIQEEIPEMGETHDQTVSGMIKKLDEYIKRQETAITNMQTLGGVGSVVVSPATGGGQPERSAATGMPYVPRDMNVRVHQGEAIVPASETGSPRALHIHMHNPVVRDDRDIDLLTNALYRRLQRA